MDLRVCLVFVAVAVCGVLSRAHGNRRCMRPCTADYTPVCGSDGKTYSNRCELDVTAECRKRNLRFAHEGECTQALPERRPERDCRIMCTMQYDPVCGNDGKTYGNACGLRAANCRNRSKIEIVHQGECRN